MNTIKQNQATFTDFQVKSSSTKHNMAVWLSRQSGKFETTRLGFMAIYITIQSCLGSITCMYLLKNSASDFALCLCAGLTMVCNAIFIAQGKGSWCLISFYASIIINSFLLLGNL